MLAKLILYSLLTQFNLHPLSSVPTSYYVANGNYPFAIHLSGATNFNTPETHPIDKSFEHFMDWVNSNGTDYKDWYK